MQMEFLEMMSKMKVRQDDEAPPAEGGGEGVEGEIKEKICIKPQKKLAEFIMKIYQYVFPPLLQLDR